MKKHESEIYAHQFQGAWKYEHGCPEKHNHTEPLKTAQPMRLPCEDYLKLNNVLNIPDVCSLHVWARNRRGGKGVENSVWNFLCCMVFKLWWKIATGTWHWRLYFFKKHHWNQIRYAHFTGNSSQIILHGHMHFIQSRVNFAFCYSQRIF